MPVVTRMDAVAGKHYCMATQVYHTHHVVPAATADNVIAVDINTIGCLAVGPGGSDSAHIRIAMVVVVLAPRIIAVTVIAGSVMLMHMAVVASTGITVADIHTPDTDPVVAATGWKGRIFDMDFVMKAPAIEDMPVAHIVIVTAISRPVVIPAAEVALMVVTVQRVYLLVDYHQRGHDFH